MWFVYSKNVFITLYAITLVHSTISEWVKIPQTSTPKDLFLTTTDKAINASYFEIDMEESDRNKLEESLPDFLPFVGLVQTTLLEMDSKDINDKLSFLKYLRDNLVINIEKKMQALWLKPISETREYKGEHYHMDFPSNEGALMTIGFLTFSVFLIKLILKLIHALKTKYNTYYNNSDSSTATTYFGRKRRSLDESLNILQMIEEYNYT